MRTFEANEIVAKYEAVLSEIFAIGASHPTPFGKLQVIYTSQTRGFPIGIWIPWLLFMGRHYEISFSRQNLWSIMISAWRKKTSSVSLIYPDFGTNVNLSQTISKPWENYMLIFQIFYTDCFSLCIWNYYDRSLWLNNSLEMFPIWLCAPVWSLALVI